ncbi:ATP-binding protein [Streptomyces sp. NPDC096324]|uniref:ATP-binding protein n=1 Tax=Streptomyces sp. NPDC096324 TaxID=3366085 RepID=UPI0037FC4142
MNTSPDARSSRPDERPRSVSCRLYHRPESSRIARRFTRATLRAWAVDEVTADKVLLVVSELVTNAVVHALPPVTLRLSRPSAHVVRAEVADGGPARAQESGNAHRAPEEHGRGSDIVVCLSVAHGCRADHGTVSRWADVGAA